MEENKYSVKDLCNIFNINTNTFPSIARRLNINTEEYCKTEINEFNSPKKYYNELAYKKIEEYALSKEKNKVVLIDNYIEAEGERLVGKEILGYLPQEISEEDKEKTIDDLRKQLDFTQKLLVTEKGEKQQLQQQIFLLSEDNKKISELETENKNLLSTNKSYMEENHNLQKEKYGLEQELNKIKNRGFFARLFNK